MGLGSKDELQYKRKLIKLMVSSGWRVWRHEDKIEFGTPDLYFSGFGIEGWMEVKYLKSPVLNLGKISHYTVTQERRLKEMGESGTGNCFLWVGSAWEHIVWPHSSLSFEFRKVPMKAAMVKSFVHSSTIEKAEWLFTNRLVINRGVVDCVDDLLIGENK